MNKVKISTLLLTYHTFTSSNRREQLETVTMVETVAMMGNVTANMTTSMPDKTSTDNIKTIDVKRTQKEKKAMKKQMRRFSKMFK